jgi:EAL domain-containing protein (putative c-di-GMP-specific phosphodiesterase class I)
MAQDSHRFISFAFTGADLLVEIDETGLIGFALGAGASIVNVDATSLQNQSFEALFSPRDRDMVKAALDGLVPGERVGPLAVQLSETHGGRSANLSLARWPDRAGFISCTLAATTGRSTPKHTTDAQTGVLTNDAFRSLVENLASASSSLGDSLTLTLFDVRGLASLEEKLPASTTNELMQRVVGILRSRALDGHAVGRIGPEQFGTLQRGPAATQALSQQIAAAAAEVSPKAKSLKVSGRTVSLASKDLSTRQTFRAVSYVLDRFHAGDELPDQLDSALEESVASTVTRIQDFQAMVRMARFRLVYQPIVKLADGALDHYEALTRFQDDHSPFELVRFAEDLEIIEQFDFAVAAKAIQRLKDGARAPLAVNLSGRSIDSDAFIAVLLKLLDENVQLAPQLSFEITESSQLADLERANRIVQELRQRGFKVCIDDFGSGAASFHYLKALNLDAVKIDGSLVQSMEKSERDEAMVRNIARMCADLGVATIAEMIETQWMAERLMEIGVDFGQGFLFGKPAANPAPAASRYRPAQGAPVTARKRAAAR